MGLSLRLADAPPALAALHREHMDRQMRFRAAAIVARLPAPVPLAATTAAAPAHATLPRGFLIKKEMAELWAAYAALILQIHEMSFWWQKERRLTTAEVIQAVCARYGVSFRDVASERRTAEIVRPRQVACFLCHRLTIASLPRIGRRLGRDHTSVLHAVRKIDRLAFGPDPDVTLRAELIGIAASLGRTL